MTQYDNTNRFALFKNTNKRDDKDADYTGSVNIDGREFWLNGWIKEGAKGKFFSGTVKPKAAPPAEQSISERAMPKRRDPISSGRGHDADSDIPF